ncbi:MAG: 4-hydroxy-tetrahydrodipicolinate reductase [Armatimonadota bacterium]
MRVAVCGYLGRMGSNVVEAVNGAQDMDYVGGADFLAEEGSSSAVCVKTVDELLATAKPHVVVDFTIPSSVFENARKILGAGVHCVIGTTGLKQKQLDELDSLAKQNRVGVLVAPNFAVGAVLMMQFAKQAARHFQGVEIIELHHEKKLDSPSGTALMTAGKIAETWSGSVRAEDEGQVARGENASGIQIHSVRLPGLVAHQEVLFGNPGEALTIRHDSFDRKSFMPGVLLGVRRIREHQGVVFGLENFLFE